MPKVAFFGHISPTFLDTPKNFLPPPPPKIFQPLQFSYPFRPENSFFRLYRPKKCFLALKKFF